MNEFVRRPVLYEDRYPDEHNPKQRDRQGYSMAKIIAQRAFSDAAEQSGDWDATSGVLGRIAEEHARRTTAHVFQG